MLLYVARVDVYIVSGTAVSFLQTCIQTEVFGATPVKLSRHMMHNFVLLQHYLENHL